MMFYQDIEKLPTDNTDCQLKDKWERYLEYLFDIDAVPFEVAKQGKSFAETIIMYHHKNDKHTCKLSYDWGYNGAI